MAVRVRSSDAPPSNEVAASDCGCSGARLRGDSGTPWEDATVCSGEESPAFVGGASHGGWRVLGSNTSGYSGTEPPGSPLPQTCVDHGTSHRSDEVRSAKASPSDGNLALLIPSAKKCPPFFMSTPAHCTDDEQLNTLHHTSATCSGCDSQLLRDLHSHSVATDDEQPSERDHVPFGKDSGAEKRRASESDDYATSTDRVSNLARSSSERHFGRAAGNNFNSPGSRLHPVTLPISRLRECGKPRQSLSASPNKPPDRERKLSSQALCIDLKKARADRLVEAQHNEMENAGVCQPKRALSEHIEDTNKAGVQLDDDDLAEPRLCSHDTVAADGPAVAQKSTTATRLMQSSASEEINIQRQLLNVGLPNHKGGDGCYAVNDTEPTKECRRGARNLLSISEGNGGTTQWSDSLGLSESLLLDFDADSLGSSAHNGNLGATQPGRQDKNGSQEGRSSDSAQLSPQPEFSFVWSGSGSTTLSWSALEPRFLRSPPPSLWADLSTTANDKPVAAEGSAHVKNASVPDRPEKDDIRAAGVPGRAKRTVSCPLSFDADSICYETGDQEAFRPRRSSSNCWCCDKDERGLESQGSARMEIQQYLRLRERLGQRHRKPVPQEDLKSDQSGTERDLDMATLDCSVAGMERHGHVIELFSNPSSSSLPRTTDSLEEWFKEGLPAFYEDFAEDRHGAFQPVPLDADDKKHCQRGEDKSDRSEFSADDADDSTPGERCAVQEETSKRTGKAGICRNTIRPGILNDAIPGVLYEFGKYDSPTGAFEGCGESTAAKKLAEEDLLAVPTPKAGRAAISILPPRQTVAVKYVSKRYSGMQLAEELDKFATGVSLNDVALVPCRRTVHVSQVPCLDDIDFSKYVTNDTLSVPEALARMPRIVCNETFLKK